MPKLFGTLRKRYATRPGGYTRVLRTEPKSTYDQANSAILELVDGPKDMRFHMTAATVARNEALGIGANKITLLNRKKVTQFREGGKEEFKVMVQRLRRLGFGDSPEEKKARHDARLERLKEAKKDKKPGENQSKATPPLDETVSSAGQGEGKNVSVLR
jgi:hypothetical protein